MITCSSNLKTNQQLNIVGVVCVLGPLIRLFTPIIIEIATLHDNDTAHRRMIEIECYHYKSKQRDQIIAIKSTNVGAVSEKHNSWNKWLNQI